MRRVAQIALVVLGLVVVVSIVFRGSPPTARIPNSRLVFDRPETWHEANRSRVLDPAWAEEQKQLYPSDTALVDAMVEAFRTGQIDYHAWIELDGDLTRPDGWVEASVVNRGATPLADEARASVDRQGVSVLPGTTAVNAPLPIGLAVRLDWSYGILFNDGGSETVYVRSYWLDDASTRIVVQLGTNGARPEVVANFDAVAATFRWGN